MCSEKPPEHESGMDQDGALKHDSLASEKMVNCWKDNNIRLSGLRNTGETCVKIYHTLIYKYTNTCPNYGAFSEKTLTVECPISWNPTVVLFLL